MEIIDLKTRNMSDGTLKVFISSIDMVTWAKDHEDAKVAVAEAMKCHRLNIEKFGE